MKEEVIGRPTHEWYLKGNKKVMCRHCGLRTTIENINDIKQRCIWPNALTQGGDISNE